MASNTTTAKPIHPEHSESLWQGLSSYIVVFTASGCVLALEIVAGRILAPIIGVSLYTWTSIIGIVLAGISIGNYLGGVIADRFPGRHVLGLVLLSSSVGSISILPLIEITSDGFSSVPIAMRIVLLTTILFSMPSVMLGMITPIVVKLRLSDIALTGNIVGKTYAVSTAGSIFGTFITGFMLIQWVGTRWVLLAVAVVLFLLALAFGRPWKMKIPTAILLAIFIVVGTFAVKMGSLRASCLVESSYYCINISEQESNGRDVSTLSLDNLIHSYIDLDDPTFLVYEYERLFADISTYIGERNPHFNSLFIGGGGYTMPRFIETQYGESKIEVVDIDPAVTEVVHDYLGMPRDTSIITYNNDARTKFFELPENNYDLIAGDAFNHFSVPYHLTTLEFNKRIKELLKDDGIYVMNVIDKLHSGRFLRAIAHTLEQTFEFVYLMNDNPDWSNDDRYTFVVVASDTPISLSDIEEANASAGRLSIEFIQTHSTHIMSSEAYNAWINDKDNILLTDDFVPVDNLLAPLFIDEN